jgi:large conductance mechanosensitive channel
MTKINPVEPKKVKKHVSTFMTEFEKFALKGNVIDLAVGVIIGTALKDLIKTFVNDILMPPISIFTGSFDFTQKFITLKGARYENLADAEKAGAIILKYGDFLTNLIDFFITAFVIFLLVKFLNNLKIRQKEADDAKPLKKSTKKCPYCFSEIHIDATRCAYCTQKISK